MLATHCCCSELNLSTRPAKYSPSGPVKCVQMLILACAPVGGWIVVAMSGPPSDSVLADGCGAVGTGVASPPPVDATGLSPAPVEAAGVSPPVPVEGSVLAPPVLVEGCALLPPVPVDETATELPAPPVPVDAPGARDAAGDDPPPPPQATAMSAMTVKTATARAGPRCAGPRGARSIARTGDFVTRTPPPRPPKWEQGQGTYASVGRFHSCDIRKVRCESVTPPPLHVPSLRQAARTRAAARRCSRCPGAGP